MLELRIIAQGAAIPIFDLPAALGRAGAAKEVGDTIDGLMAFLDDLGGDPDLEDGGDLEPTGDELDASFPEWRAGSRRRMQRHAEPALWSEDAEQDDEPEDSDSDRCAAGDDHMIAGAVAQRDLWFRYGHIETGDEVDAEASCPPSYMVDQTRPLFVTAANDWPETSA